jgi:hypothetical protein
MLWNNYLKNIQKNNRGYFMRGSILDDSEIKQVQEALASCEQEIYEVNLFGIVFGCLLLILVAVVAVIFLQK